MAIQYLVADDSSSLDKGSNALYFDSRDPRKKCDIIIVTL